MCAIVGIYGNENAARLASVALFAMQHRGQEATGISSSCDGKIYTKKDRGLVSEVFNNKALEYLKGNMAIGHNRYATAGSDSVLDAQPVYAKYKLGEISIVHNGNLINKDEVRLGVYICSGKGEKGVRMYKMFVDQEAVVAVGR